MQVHSRESRKAHSQTGRPFRAAASSLPQPHDSPAEDFANCAAPQPVTGDVGAVTGQTFAAPAVRPRHHVRPIPPEVLRRIFDEDRALNRRDDADAPTWRQIAVASLAAAALVLFLFFLDGGWIIR